MKTSAFFGSMAMAVVGSFSATAATSDDSVPLLDRLRSQAPRSITGNPAAENALPGTGLAGQLLHLPEDSGLRLGVKSQKGQSVI